MTKTAQTKIYSKIIYIKKRINHANQQYNNTEINNTILKKKLRHYNKQIKEFERDYILLPNLHIEIIKMKQILNKEIKNIENYLNKQIHINWETGEINIK